MKLELTKEEWEFIKRQCEKYLDAPNPDIYETLLVKLGDEWQPREGSDNV